MKITNVMWAPFLKVSPSRLKVQLEGDHSNRDCRAIYVIAFIRLALNVTESSIFCIIHKKWKLLIAIIVIIFIKSVEAGKQYPPTIIVNFANIKTTHVVIHV